MPVSPELSSSSNLKVQMQKFYDRSFRSSVNAMREVLEDELKWSLMRRDSMQGVVVDHDMFLYVMNSYVSSIQASECLALELGDDFT